MERARRVPKAGSPVQLIVGHRSGRATVPGRKRGRPTPPPDSSPVSTGHAQPGTSLSLVSSPHPHPDLVCLLES